jgi:hypothetical protein
MRFELTTFTLGSRKEYQMPHEFHIDAQVGLLCETYTGSLNIEALTNANAAILAHPDYRKHLDFMTDMRRAQMPFGYDEMYQHVSSLPPLHISRQAFVVTNKAEFGMIRMFIALSESSKLYEEARIFSSTEEGMTWLSS